MILTAAKCTQCSANLEVDPTQEATVCSFCGTPFITEKAINSYIANAQINAQTVNVNLGGNIKQLKENAEKSLIAKQYKNARLDFEKVIELDRCDYEAYWGLCRIQIDENPKMPFESNDIYNSAIAYAPEETANEYKMIVDKHNKANEEKMPSQSLIVFVAIPCILFAILGLIGLIVGILLGSFG